MAVDGSGKNMYAAFGIQMLWESVDELDDLAPWGWGGMGVLDVFPSGLIALNVVSDSEPAAAHLMSRSARLHTWAQGSIMADIKQLP